ncbi:MAG TPA: type III pantothenate kinase [Dissulfurispiraceae bacterium]|nr:type III pantothenate kinase [Dissulfurispiraceae bacterium]
MRLRIPALLAIDVGNSTIGLGLYPDASKEKPLSFETISWRNQSAETLSLHFNKFFRKSNEAFQSGDVAVVISSVVPGLNRRILSSVKVFCNKPLTVDYRLISGITFAVPHPETIGSDRIMNAIAGQGLFGRSVAVVDFGTATTITVVGKHDEFLGGAILPGLDMMQKSLTSGTAKLPAIALDSPRSALGRDTASAIASGIVIGSAGAVDRIIGRLEIECSQKLRAVLTGGRAELVSPYLSKKHIVVPHLIFEGMRLFFLRHAGNAGYNYVY